MKNVVIFGSGGHAKVIADIIEKNRVYKVVGLVVSNQNEGFWDYPIIGRDDELPMLIHKYDIYGGIVGVGDNWIRHTIVNKIVALKNDFLFIQAIHPSVQLGKNVGIGAGTVLMAGVVVSTDTSIGSHCILNTNSSVDHDNVIEDFSSLGPNVSTGGNVAVGTCTALASGVNVIHRINIGAYSVVGAGATVVNHIDSGVVAYGVPAKIIRKRMIGDQYL